VDSKYHLDSETELELKTTNQLENESIINESNNNILDKNDHILETTSIDGNKSIE
jgi:hypothetical protein